MVPVKSEVGQTGAVAHAAPRCGTPRGVAVELNSDTHERPVKIVVGIR
jgi:hypothetical protein